MLLAFIRPASMRENHCYLHTKRRRYILETPAASRAFFRHKEWQHIVVHDDNIVEIRAIGQFMQNTDYEEGKDSGTYSVREVLWLGRRFKILSWRKDDDIYLDSVAGCYSLVVAPGTITAQDTTGKKIRFPFRGDNFHFFKSESSLVE